MIRYVASVVKKPDGGWAGTLNETAKLLASDGEAMDQLGCAVDVDGDTVRDSGEPVIRNGHEPYDDVGIDEPSGEIERITGLVRDEIRRGSLVRRVEHGHLTEAIRRRHDGWRPR